MLVFRLASRQAPLQAVGSAPLVASWFGCTPSFLAACFASSSKVAKKRQKPSVKHSRHPLFKREKSLGDFPVQLRPAKPPEIQDLHDAALDTSVDRIYKPKPHKVREVVESLKPARHAGTEDDTITLQALRKMRSGQEHAQRSPAIPNFNPERDLGEEDAAALAASKARELAKRNYKFLPNPYGARPGPLGTDAASEAKYYSRYFDGTRPSSDRQPLPTKDGTPEELTEEGRSRAKRERISPKRFWIQPDHVTPDPPMVAFMNSRELKYSMVNEAYLIRKWRNEQPEGRASGLPAGAAELWLAFGYRAMELSSGQGSTRQKTESLDGHDATGKTPPTRCSLSTTLRFLQTMASVQAGPYSALHQLFSRTFEHAKELRPHQCFFVLQAMSRLRIKHPKASGLLQRLSLAWRALPEKKFVKAANAIAKLDLGSSLWANPLKIALAAWLPKMSGKHLVNLKAIAVMELLNTPAVLEVYLRQCEKVRDQIWYSRHLQMVELYVHLVHPDLWNSLDEHLRLFLQEVRSASEKSRIVADADVPSDSDEDETDDDSDGSTRRATTRNERVFDRRLFSSELHCDISRVMRDRLAIEHQSKVAAGPLVLDICHVATMTVVEAAARWQFYLRSPHFTALARRRQELLKAMGFKLVIVPYHRWDALQDDTEKAAYLEDQLRKVMPIERNSETEKQHHEQQQRP